VPQTSNVRGGNTTGMGPGTGNTKP
jgi:hypothetical protein